LFISVRTRVEQFFLNREARSESLLLFLLFAAAFLVRIWGISKDHFWDEMVYLQNAQVICCGKINYSELDFRPPLISLIWAGVFLLWHHIYAACIVTAFLNALGPVFLYLAGRMSVGRLPAAIAALLLAFSPFFVGVFPNGFASDATGNSLLTDSPALTLVLLAFWLLLRALDRQSTPRFAWAGLALALSILMRFGTLPSVGMLFLLPLAAKQRWKALMACGVGLLVGLSPYLIWSRLIFGAFFFTLQAGWTHVEGSAESIFFLPPQFRRDLHAGCHVWTCCGRYIMALAAPWCFPCAAPITLRSSQRTLSACFTDFSLAVAFDGARLLQRHATQGTALHPAACPSISAARRLRSSALVQLAW
jgi:4-amino-4-deoxy-L-arabinose transferase-like glycosyltransferase